MTRTPSTTNDAAADLATFCRFLDARRSSCAAALAQDTSLAQLPEAGRLQLADRIMGAFIATLGDTGALVALLEQLVQEEAVVRLGESSLNELLTSYRRLLLDVSLEAVLDEVAGARAGMHLLMEHVNVAHAVVLGFFQARAASELRVFRSLFEHAPDAMVITDMERMVTHANAAFRNGIGYGDQWLGLSMHDFDLVPPEVLPKLIDALTSTGLWQGHTTIRRKDGSEYVSHTTIFAIRDERGAPHAMASISRDISDQLRRESELRAVNARLEQSLATSPLATIEWDHDGTIMRWNPAAERIFGWTAAEAVGKNIITLLVPDVQVDEARAISAGVLRNESAASLRHENKCKDGRIITCRWYNALLRDERGQEIGALSQVEDVTEALRAEQALRESQQLLQGVIDNNPSGISVVDLERRILLLNRTVEKNMGMSRQQMIGRPQTDFFPADVVAEWALSDQEVVDTKQVVVTENTAPLADGDHIFTSVKFPLINERGAVYAIGNIITDITDQRRADSERAELQEQVIQAQQAALRELSTPLIPLADGVVAMPLIGSVDSGRAQQVIEGLLDGVATNHARVAILDITGVPVVDTQVANALIRAAQAVKLLGAKVVLTGIRPEVAQTLVGLGVDLAGITTRSSLQAGIAYAMGR